MPIDPIFLYKPSQYEKGFITTYEYLVAAIAWIDPNDKHIGELPNNSNIPPSPNSDWTVPYDAPAYLAEAKGLPYGYSYYELPRGTGKRWQQLVFANGRWDREVAMHPWYHASMGLIDSGNPGPPRIFVGLNELRDWMKGNEYRAVIAMKIKANYFRDQKLLSADLEDYIIHPGWTPMRAFFSGTVGKIIASFMSFILIGVTASDYERGDQKDVAQSQFATNDKIVFTMTESIRIAPKGNEIQRKLTNRDAPWITAKAEMKLPIDRKPTQSDFVLTTSPRFPTWNLYFGSRILNLFDMRPPGDSQIQFINRGDKINPKGV
jgi:hypothetical protein